VLIRALSAHQTLHYRIIDSSALFRNERLFSWVPSNAKLKRFDHIKIKYKKKSYSKSHCTDWGPILRNIQSATFAQGIPTQSSIQSIHERHTSKKRCAV